MVGAAFHDYDKKALRVVDVTPEGSDYLTLDVDEASATITYVGKEDKDGNWLIMKIDTTAGTFIRYASKKNNPSYADYASAWTDRALLVYGTASEVM